MSQLQLLQSASSLRHVAELLQFRPSAVAYILYKKPEQTKYTSFEIMKRGGGVRQIHAPIPELMLLQSRLSALLQNCIDEINQTNNWDDRFSHGFKRQRSIITNAKNHKKKRYVFNLDLDDFFGTINFGRVRAFFLYNRNFQLTPKVATVLAQIACYRDSLPQGSPCSPVISNLIGHILDVRLCKLASRAGCTYSRYADDLTFSTNDQNFPPTVARMSQGQDKVWEVGDELSQAISRAGFSINPRKTRMQCRPSRQDVTGLVVNKKVNIRADYRHTVRAMAHRLFMTGHFKLVKTMPDQSGVLVPTITEGTLAQLHGMLGHIDFVDRYNFDLQSKSQSNGEQVGLGSKENLYRRFLIFKEFYAAVSPVILCEGKTDNTYIRHAIRQLASNFPTLATMSENNKITLNVRIFKYPNTSTGRILRLNGGTGELTKFIAHYVKEVKKFKAPGNEHPIILLVDNDGGAAPILKTAKQFSKVQPTRHDPFIPIFGNLYLVLTPLIGGEDSKIEDSFSEETKGITLGGKTFNPDNLIDPDKHYGKYVFSQFIDQHADKIDFSGFTKILSRLSAVVEAHQKTKA
jgi:RNA-directed DNA polymerase